MAAAAESEDLEVPVLTRGDVEAAIRAAARRCFTTIDTDSDRSLDIDELARYFALVTKADDRPMLSQDEARRVATAALASADMDHDGTLSADEFVAAFVSRVVAELPDYLDAVAAQQFVLIADSCRLALEALGDAFPTEASLQRAEARVALRLFRACDADSDGLVSRRELETLMRDCVVPTLYHGAGAGTDTRAETSRRLRSMDIGLDGKCSRAELLAGLDAMRREFAVSRVQWLGLCSGVFLPVLERKGRRA